MLVRVLVLLLTSLGLSVPAQAAAVPDLTVRDGWARQHGTTAVAGFKVLRRSGSVRRTRYAVGVRAPSGWVELGHGRVRGLELGVPKAVRLDLDLTPLPNGQQTLTGCVDTAGAVRESNEDNNCRPLGKVTVGPTTPPDPGPPRPVVDGNLLNDARTGKAWIPRGANWPDLEYSCAQGWIPQHPAAEALAMADWGLNVVRLPLNQDCWLGVDGDPTGDWAGASAYQAAVATRVEDAHAAGLAVILELHWAAPEGVQAATGQRAMADAQSAVFWSQVATAYRDDPSVMFDLYNEPYSVASYGAAALTWGCWRDGGCRVDTAPEGQALTGQTYQVVGMAELLAAVRGAGATQPVLLSGMDYANDLTGWLSHRPGGDRQLVAAFHNYAHQGCGPACWDGTILGVAAQVPVVMTEFGYSSQEPGWMDKVMTWGDDHGIGYLAWAWWNLPADEQHNADYALLQSDSYEPRSPAGTTYHDHLATLP
ncbi:MAG TPA: cellulase family glycosylhydrolase [Nocardioides sp.]|nr:cellulase family glycosylhydrolase [Nocardioides sp.]